MDTKQALFDYLRQHKHMTMATASLAGIPEAATVQYYIDGDSLLINTFTEYRKYGNLQSNPRVAGVVTVGHEWTLQFDGEAAELQGKEAIAARAQLLASDPAFADFFDEQKTRFFKITPTWMRLRDYRQSPIAITEWQA